MKEITIELTDFCPNSNICQFCSSNATSDMNKSKFINLENVKKYLLELGEIVDRIHISGGEPLAHPNFYKILNICKSFAKDVVVHSNAINHLAYNPKVTDVYLEAYLTVTPETDKIRILRRVKQGKELDRPEVSKSRNHEQDCEGTCGHSVLRADGLVVKAPCAKSKLKEL